MVGTGYVGLAYAAALAELQHEVTGLDVVPSRVASLQRGIAPFFEPGLNDLLVRGTTSRRLRFSTDYRYLGIGRAGPLISTVTMPLAVMQQQLSGAPA